MNCITPTLGFYHMDMRKQVSITPEVTSRGVNRAVMEQLVKVYQDSALGRRLPAYDGRKSLYTAGPLPFQSKDFTINLLDEDDGSGAPRCACLYYYLFPLMFNFMRNTWILFFSFKGFHILEESCKGLSFGRTAYYCLSLSVFRVFGGYKQVVNSLKL